MAYNIIAVQWWPFNAVSSLTVISIFTELSWVQFPSQWSQSLFKTSPKTLMNKKVLLRERKRHTARHVASTPYVVLSWLTPPPPAGWPPSGWTWPPRQLDLTPPTSWTWPTPPGPTGPDPPIPKPAGPDPPPQLDLTPPLLAGPDPPPPAESAECPPPVDRQTDTCQNITFPSYSVRGR